MGKVGRFITDPKAGAYCQVTLDSGDKLIVNHARGGFKGGPLTIETTKWWGGGQRIVSIDLDSAAGQGGPGEADGRAPGRERAGHAARGIRGVHQGRVRRWTTSRPSARRCCADDRVTAPPLYGVLPFVAMLLAIAVCPLWIPHWWESNRNKLLASAVLGLPVLAFYGLAPSGRAPAHRRSTTPRSSSCSPACS